MAKARNFIIMAIAMMMAFLSSCSESTFLGIEEPDFVENGNNNNDDPEGYSGYRYDADLAMEFDTTAMQLYTVRQTVAGIRNVLENGDTLATEEFSRDLNLEVNFSLSPYKVYVAEDSLLTRVALVSDTTSSVSETEDEDEEFCTINKEQNYTFVFNGDETVEAAAVWQALRCAVVDTTFACANVKNVAFDSFEATLNETMSNADSTVYDVDLLFNVELACEKMNWDSVYTVRVPEVRIYKSGYIPPVPDEYETKIENSDYKAAFETATLSLVTDYQTVSGDVVTYKNGSEEISRENFAKDLNLQALFTSPERVYVESEAQLSNISMTSSSHGGDYVSRDADGRFTTATSTLDYNFRFNEGEAVEAATEYQYLSYGDTTFVYSAIQDIRFNRAEVSENAAASTDELKVVNVVLYFNVEVVREDPEGMVATKSARTPETYEVAVPYERALRVEAPVDELVEKTYRDVVREIVDANTERISWTEVETWSVSGEKTNTISFNLYRHFQSPAMQTVYTANDQYNTVSNGSSLVRESESKDGNWTVTTRYMQYTSTATNGVDPFNNVYTYDFQKAVFANEYYTLSFDYADWTINEGASNVTAAGEQTVNGVVYNVSNYVNNINTVYSFSSERYDASASAEARIYVEKEIDKIIPDEWGKIIGAGISAVPTDPNGTSAQKCLTIRTDKGAVAVTFSMNADMPSVSSILSGYFVEGNFGAEYNSGYYTTSVNHGSYDLGKWAPAIARDLSDRIAYYRDDTIVRNIRTTTLKMWDWRGGNLSTVVDGYVFSVSDSGVLTVSLNGNVVMQIR